MEVIEAIDEMEELEEKSHYISLSKRGKKMGI